MTKILFIDSSIFFNLDKISFIFKKFGIVSIFNILHNSNIFFVNSFLSVFTLYISSVVELLFNISFTDCKNSFFFFEEFSISVFFIFNLSKLEFDSFISIHIFFDCSDNCFKELNIS